MFIYFHCSSGLRKQHIYDIVISLIYHDIIITLTLPCVSTFVSHLGLFV